MNKDVFTVMSSSQIIVNWWQSFQRLLLHGSRTAEISAVCPSGAAGCKTMSGFKVVPRIFFS